MVAVQNSALPKENHACVMHAVGTLIREERPLPQDPGPDEY